MGLSASREIPFTSAASLVPCKAAQSRSAEVALNGSPHGKAHCVLAADRIRLQFHSDTALDVNFDDMICATLVTKDVNSNICGECAHLQITAYPIVYDKRTKLEICIAFEDSDEAESWNRFIKKTIDVPTATHLTKSTNHRCRTILVIANPFSGQKKAISMWEEHVKPIFHCARLQYELILTEYERHGTEIAKCLCLDKYDGIAVVSGDGLVSEIIAGFLMRADRERALKMPIAHIPGGTSNALAAAICFQCNEPFSPRNVFCLESALMVTRPRYLPLRICHVQTEHDGDRAMFMSATWGLIADIDIGSERFRWAGMARLHIEAVIRIMQLPSVARYKGRISYLPVGDVALKKATRLRHIVDRAEFGSGHFDYAAVESATGNEIETAAVDDLKDALEGSDLVCGGRVPQLNEQIPTDWVTLEGEFVYVCVVNISHLGSDLPYLPSSRLDNHFVYLTIVDWNAVESRFQIAKMMITIDGSHHLSYPCLQIIPVHACRVEPLESCGGYIAIDGEPVSPGTAFQVVPSKYCATVIGRKERK